MTQPRENKTYSFTINRNGRWERTVVGKTGRIHHPPAAAPGKDGHFTNEGEYRKAIDAAVSQNSKN